MDFIDLLSIFLPVLAFICVLIILSLNIYRKLRPNCSINVNCWFCNQWSKLPYEFQNSWDCVYCEQYNGFTKDGDYNKPIPAQHDELMNKVPAAAVNGCNVGSDNGLCNSCNNNQQLKIQQLAMFCPIDENKFDEEVERYKKQLERAYRLCPACELTVKRTLHKQKSLLLGLRLSTLRKQGLDYLDLNRSLPGLSRSAKRNFFLTALRFTIGALAFLHLVDSLKSCNFSNEAFSKTLPRFLVPYFLLAKDSVILLKNGALFMCDCVEYFYGLILQSYVQALFGVLENYAGNFYVPFVESRLLRNYLLSFLNANRSAILTYTGLFLQIVYVVFSSSVQLLEFSKCALWALLMLTDSGRLNEYYASIYLPPIFVEILLCCFIVAIKSSSYKPRKLKKNSIEKSRYTAKNQEKDFSDEELENDATEVLNSTFKTHTTDALNSSNTSTKTQNLFNISDSGLKLFHSAFRDSDTSPVFGQQPIFDNPLNTSYFKCSPKYRSEGSSNGSFSTRKSCINDSINSAYFDKISETLTSSTGDSSGEFRASEVDLNKGLSELHLSADSNVRKGSSLDLPPVFRVASPFVARPKPVLSPPKLGNITQSSWVAGGYWKPSSEFLHNSGSCSNLSRSSSQSSGFGSQTSSQPHIFDGNVYNSLPSSRNNSYCGEFDKFSVLSEPAYQSFCPQNYNLSHRRPETQLYTTCVAPGGCVAPSGGALFCRAPPASNYLASNCPTSNSPASNCPTSNFAILNSPATNCRTSNFPASNCPTSNSPASNCLTSNFATSNCPTSSFLTSNCSTSNSPASNCRTSNFPDSTCRTTNFPPVSFCSFAPPVENKLTGRDGKNQGVLGASGCYVYTRTSPNKYFGAQFGVGAFSKPPSPFVANMRPLSACSNNSTTQGVVKGALLKKWREQHDSLN